MRAANLGQNWNNGSESGSRASNSNNPWKSNTNIGSRGRCDDYELLYTYLKRRCKPVTTSGQLKCPATANTSRGSVKRRVPLRREMRDRQSYG